MTYFTPPELSIEIGSAPDDTHGPSPLHPGLITWGPVPVQDTRGRTLTSSYCECRTVPYPPNTSLPRLCCSAEIPRTPVWTRLPMFKTFRLTPSRFTSHRCPTLLSIPRKTGLKSQEGSVRSVPSKGLGRPTAGPKLQCHRTLVYGHRDAPNKSRALTVGGTVVPTGHPTRLVSTPGDAIGN